MSRQHIAFGGACLASCGLAFGLMNAWGQDTKSESRSDSKGGTPVAAAGDQVIVKRDAMQIEPPHKYKVPLALEPIRSVILTAPFDGIVRQSDIKPNAKLQSQTEVLRLDTQVAKLNVQRTDSLLKIATAEQKQAADKDELQKTVAQARVEVAKAEADLAKHVLEQASVRTPFSGELQRMLVGDGQFVRAGDPLAIVVDSSKLKVEVPAERAQVAQGKTLSIKVESADVEAKVESVLPLDAKFAGIREVFDSVASAVLNLDNADGRFKPGQTVYVPLIPRQPVSEIRTSAIGNLADGQRKVQVVRHGIVRDIPVVVMGSVGVNRVFVSGAFADGDEVIYESSHLLSDAFQLRPVAIAATSSPGTGTTNPPSSENTGGKPKGPGF